VKSAETSIIRPLRFSESLRFCSSDLNSSIDWDQWNRKENVFYFVYGITLSPPFMFFFSPPLDGELLLFRPLYLELSSIFKSFQNVFCLKHTVFYNIHSILVPIFHITKVFF